MIRKEKYTKWENFARQAEEAHTGRFGSSSIALVQPKVVADPNRDCAPARRDLDWGEVLPLHPNYTLF